MDSQVHSLLEWVVAHGGSDLHIATHSPPMARLQGELVPVADRPRYDATAVEAIVAGILPPELAPDLRRLHGVDFALRVANVGIFRANVFRQHHGLSIVLRPLPETPPSLESIGAPAVCARVCSHPHGLILVTGPTGSGKSTTLAAMLDHINSHERGHIITLEDPIEFHHEPKLSLVSQRQLGLHFTSFASALSSALRADPDTILIGEMRDPDTMALAISAAETGHLVLATLHTNTAAKAVDRILDSFPTDRQAGVRAMLAESLRAVITQRLVLKADRSGRVCVHEVLLNTPAVQNLIRESRTHQLPYVMQTSRADGMQLMDCELLELARQGVIRGEDAWANANDRSLLAEWAPADSGGRRTPAIPTFGAPVPHDWRRRHPPKPA